MQIFNNKKIAIWGFGQEGQSALSYLESLGLRADIITPEDENKLTDYDIVIKSPGISIYSDAYLHAKTKGVFFTTDTNIFLEEVKASPNDKPVTVAVTGTKGKSTTSALLAHILFCLGKKFLLGGNFGTPLTDFIPVLKAEKTDFVIAEISSYQAADLYNGFDVAILNNLYPEHLNWHLSHENYYNDKLNLIKQSKIKILNMADANTLKLGVDKAYPDSVFFNTRFGFYVVGNDLFYSDAKIISLSDTSLQGLHNLSNIAAVLTVLQSVGIDVIGDLKNIKLALGSFKPLPHRLEKVTGTPDFTFIDDSISTTPETAMAALDVFKDKQVTLIAGGFDRGQNYTELAEKIVRSKVNLITVGATGPRLFDAVMQRHGTAYRADNMRDAVKKAKEISSKGSVILLSPAAPSYDAYKNFQARGEDFKKQINNA